MPRFLGRIATRAGGGARGSPPGAPARPRNCRGEFHKQIVPKSSKKLPNEGPRSTPPLQRVQKAQKHEGLDRATAKTTTLSRIPAWTPPDAERQCYFFFRGARFARGRAIFCGKRRYWRGIWGVLFGDSQHYREVEASDRRKHVLCRWLGGPLFLELARISNTIEKVRPHVAKVPRFIGPMATRAGPGRPGVDRGRPGRFRGPPEDHFWNKWIRSLQNQ